MIFYSENQKINNAVRRCLSNSIRYFDAVVIGGGAPGCFAARDLLQTEGAAENETALPPYGFRWLMEE